MYTLYYAPGAASLAVHWLLIDLELPHTLVKLDIAAREHKTPEYLALNPSGVVPTLLVDGKPMCEAAAMAVLLAEAKPEAGLIPAPGSARRAEFLQWMFHLANSLQPPFRLWWYPQEAAGEAYAEAGKATAEARIHGVFANLDAHLGKNGPYLLGDAPCAADFMLVMLMRWSRNMPKTALDYPNLARLADLMKARPSWKALYESEGLSEWA
ncbi:glutathione S-transferase [Arenimonas maotaiensis]|uniref:Glutathione S-transferase n=1 Tax=Arenimonas maotaiensis TaxID=1446479 RepID=A0A917CUN2_9GAMM|nr:glutathione S-transferase family protein [Arenimonas maotaiensis]GGF97336.1 glutathione S-transferase [Arenimonas maotaiensis]